MTYAVPTISELRSGLALDEALSWLPLTPTEMRLFEVLLHHRNRRTGQCNPSVGRLAQLLRRCERTVQRGLNHLVELGLIRARWRKGGRGGGGGQGGWGRRGGGQGGQGRGYNRFRQGPQEVESYEDEQAA